MLKKNKAILIKIDEETLDAFKNKLQEIDSTQSGYVRYCIKVLINDPNASLELKDVKREMKTHDESIKALRNEISRIGNNLNQYIHNMNIKMKEGVLEENEMKEISHSVASTMEELRNVASKQEMEVSENA